MISRNPNVPVLRFYNSKGAASDRLESPARREKRKTAMLPSMTVFNISG